MSTVLAVRRVRCLPYGGRTVVFTVRWVRCLPYDVLMLWRLSCSGYGVYRAVRMTLTVRCVRCWSYGEFGVYRKMY